MRFAHIPRAPTEENVEEIHQYLPANYTVFCTDPRGIIIAGEDNAGWTLDAYVIPRLGSGLIHAQEVHAVFTTEPHVGTVNIEIPEICFSFAKSEIETQVASQPSMEG